MSGTSITFSSNARLLLLVILTILGSGCASSSDPSLDLHQMTFSLNGKPITAEKHCNCSPLETNGDLSLDQSFDLDGKPARIVLRFPSADAGIYAGVPNASVSFWVHDSIQIVKRITTLSIRESDIPSHYLTGSFAFVAEHDNTITNGTFDWHW
jgi:hypothetical protein